MRGLPLGVPGGDAGRQGGPDRPRRGRLLRTRLFTYLAPWNGSVAYRLLIRPPWPWPWFRPYRSLAVALGCGGSRSTLARRRTPRSSAMSRMRARGFSGSGTGARSGTRARTARAVRDLPTLRRIRSLAIPPAWTQVWICPVAHGHIQAVGRDARGRKQYRYHARWRAVRDEAKFDRVLQFGRALPAIRERVREGPGALGAAPREGSGGRRPSARDDAHPRRQRGVRA